MQTAKQIANRSTLILSVVLLLSLGAAAQEAQERRIVVSLEDRKLALIENGEVLRVYPVAVGKSSTPSPTGTFAIVNRLTTPTYYRKGVVIEPGPLNPLGTRWIGLSQKGYGIHGTNEPRSIGKAASHGCIRMSRADLEDLFTRIKVGDAVEIVGERDEQIAKIFGGASSTVVVAAASTPTAAAPAATLGQ